MDERPNIVLLVCDTLRAQTVSHCGTAADTTPCIDALATEGTAFTRAYTVSPWTLPAHASLFTGVYPSEHGADADTKYFDGGYPSLAEQLREAGYTTHAFSNNVWLTPARGMDRGFDRFRLMWQLFDTPDVAETIAEHKPGHAKVLDVMQNVLSGNVLKRAANAAYGYWYRDRTDRAARTNRRILDALDDEPFFCFANYMEPHIPYRPPRDHAEPFLPDGVSYREAVAIPQEPWDYVFGDRDYTATELDALRGLYRGAAHYLDSQIGELVEALRDRTDRDTIVAVTSDHGENIGDHGMMAHQYSLENTVLRVPMVVHGPGIRQRTVDNQVDLLDLHTTLLGLAGVDPHDAARGRDLRTSTDDKRCFAQYHHPTPPLHILMERYGEVDVAGRDHMDAVMDGCDKLVAFSDRTELRANTDDEPVTGDGPRQETLMDALETWRSSLKEGTHERREVDETVKDRLAELGYY